jgi:excinuclease UvrABC ATPase subunit
VNQGNTVVVIEHTDVIRCADHAIDLGPEGDRRGLVIATGIRGLPLIRTR